MGLIGLLKIKRATAVSISMGALLSFTSCRGDKASFTLIEHPSESSRQLADSDLTPAEDNELVAESSPGPETVPPEPVTEPTLEGQPELIDDGSENGTGTTGNPIDMDIPGDDLDEEGDGSEVAEQSPPPRS